MLHNRQRSTIVESTLLELLKRNNEGAFTQKQTVHVLLFHHMNGISEYVQQINTLHDHGIRVRICPDEEILNHYNITELAREIGVDDFITLKQMEYEKSKIEQIYIPVMPFSTVSDILHFNDMRASIRIILWALMTGKKVTAFSAGADPYHANWRLSGLDNGTTYLKHQMKKQLQQMKGFGIHLVDKVDDLVNLFTAINRNETKRVITAETIQKEIHAGNNMIPIDKGTIITPLARDLAKENQINLGEN